MASQLSLSAAARPCGIAARTSRTSAGAAIRGFVARPDGAPSRARLQPARAKSQGVGGLLDFLEAGPKMRKWYGQGALGEEDDEFYDPDDEEGPDPILVTDADTPTGELVVMQAILARQTIRVLVADEKAAKVAFGPYVKPFEGSVEDEEVLAAALRGCTSVILVGKVGMVPEIAEARKVKHLVLLSSVEAAKGGDGNLGGFSRLLNGADGYLKNSKREGKVTSGPIPYTVVRVGQIRDAQGGKEGVALKGGGTDGGKGITRQDAAEVLVGAAARGPPAAGVAIAAANDPSAALPTDWDKAFSTLVISKVL